MNQMGLALGLFAVMYAALLKWPQHRWKTALIAAGVFLITGILGITEALGAINYNVLMMLT